MGTLTLQDIWQMFLAMCGSIATIAGAVIIIYKLYQKAKQPDNERDKMMKEHEKKLDNCQQRLDSVEGGMAVLMKATLAMMNHIINGDSIEEMKKASDDIQEYLISTKTSVLRRDDK